MGFLSSVSHSSKLIEPKEGVPGTSDFYLVRSTDNNVGLQLASEVEGGLVGLSPLPVEFHAISGVKIELNCRISSWCPEHCLVVWREPSLHPTVTLGAQNPNSSGND